MFNIPKLIAAVRENTAKIDILLAIIESNTLEELRCSNIKLDEIKVLLTTNLGAEAALLATKVAEQREKLSVAVNTNTPNTHLSLGMVSTTRK